MENEHIDQERVTAQAEEHPPEPEESFAELFGKESKLPGRLEPGQKVSTRIISITNELVYVDLGGKSEGVIDRNELLAEDGSLPVQEGDQIDAFFVSSQHGMRKFTTRVRGYSTLTLAEIRDAHEGGLPVSGKVKSQVKGGFEITVGGVRCFCPLSQIDLRVDRDTATYVGQTFPFKVLEFAEEGRNIILSRKAVLEEERKEELERLKEKIQVGSELTGTIRAVQSFGVFVDVGGVDGLIPMSELGWGRMERPQEFFSVGQEVSVKVIGVDWNKERLTLSLKAMQADPWEHAAEKYPADTQVRGVVVRLAPFGAFVNLEPGIDGLLHISTLGAGKRIRHPKDVVQTGEVVDAYVVSVDQASRKIALSLQPIRAKESIPLPEVGELLDGTVERVMPYGIFVRLQSGLTGLLPNSEIGTPKGTNHSRMFPEGMAMQVLVKSVDAEKSKISLSRSGVEEKVAHDEFKQYQASVKNQERASGSLGNLGDLLKARLNLDAK